MLIQERMHEDEYAQMTYANFCNFGDVIPLNIICNPYQLLNEISMFERAKYNPRKDIKRLGLSITSLDGETNGIDLDSIKEYNKENGTSYDEMSFTHLTRVYDMSEEVQKLVDPFCKFLGRSHLIELGIGGYFPPHRDQTRYIDNGLRAVRILVPLKNCNPPCMYFNYDENILQFEHGRAYFVNTNKSHSLFSFTGSSFIVLNVKACEEVYFLMSEHFQLS